jgi:type VI secretion system secreted protein VgrG
VNGTIYVGGPATTAEADANTAYNTLAGLPSGTNLTGQDLGGMTLMPGVYTFNSSAQLSGDLMLNAMGDPNALFVFQIGSTLTSASLSSVLMENGPDCCNVYWQIGSSATLGTGTDFLGTILAYSSITLNTGAGIANGRALALNGAVTLDDSSISTPTAAIIPEPGTVSLLGAGLGLVLLGRAFRKRTA